MDQILALDRALFLLLNGAFHAPWLDEVMRIVTANDASHPFIAVTAVGLLAFGRRRGLAILLGAVVAITLSDQLASHVLKPLIGRVRPCNALPDVVLLVGCSGAFAFPSAHAANAFSGALYFSRFAPPIFTAPLFGVAALVSYSRIHVGVHYPLDLVGGAVLGLGCAASVHALMARFGQGPRRRGEGAAGRRGLPAPPPSRGGARGAPPAPGAGVG